MMSWAGGAQLGDWLLGSHALGSSGYRSGSVGEPCSAVMFDSLETVARMSDSAVGSAQMSSSLVTLARMSDSAI